MAVKPAGYSTLNDIRQEAGVFEAVKAQDLGTGDASEKVFYLENVPVGSDDGGNLQPTDVEVFKLDGNSKIAVIVSGLEGNKVTLKNCACRK